MAASCYLCMHNYGVIPGQSPGDPLGACKLCGVFACPAHGMRNKSRPAYVCGCCVVSLLTVAAGQKTGARPGGPGGGPAAGPDDPAAGEPSPGLTLWARAVDDVEDVIEDFASEHWHGVREDMEYLSGLLGESGLPEALRAYARPGAQRARHLMAAAVSVAVKLDLSERDMLPALQLVEQEVRRVPRG